MSSRVASIARWSPHSEPRWPNTDYKNSHHFKLGRISVSLSYIMGLIVEDGLFTLKLDKSTGMLGANVLFWL
jgi:hypothetical protein